MMFSYREAPLGGLLFCEGAIKKIFSATRCEVLNLWLLEVLLNFETADEYHFDSLFIFDDHAFYILLTLS